MIATELVASRTVDGMKQYITGRKVVGCPVLTLDPAEAITLAVGETIPRGFRIERVSYEVPAEESSGKTAG